MDREELKRLTKEEISRRIREGVKADGRPVDWLTAFMREVVGKTLSTLALSVGYLWAFFHPKRQAWHDLIADTLVVHRERESQQA